ncbi:MAG: DUF4294 domain-containing protein [Flavobacteriales bacterium]
MNLRVFAILSLLLSTAATAQTRDTTDVDVQGIIMGGDTLVFVQMEWAEITGYTFPLHLRTTRRYSRIERKVKKVYPYAFAAGEIMRQYEEELATIHGERERKAFIEKAEDEMTEQFEGDLRNMTVSEGILLIKLIDRETGETSYALIQELKGKFSAFMWQSVARLFGYNLKNEFDAEGDDAIINDIVERIESGEIKVVERQVDLAVSE